MPSLRDLVLLAPRPLRKFVRYRLLPRSFSRRLARAIDSSLGEVSPRQGEGSRPRGVSKRARALVDKLYGGFSTNALIELEELKLQATESPADAAYAALTLGNWYLSRGEFVEAYANVCLAKNSKAAGLNRNTRLILETDCLFELGRREEAFELVRPALEQKRKDVNLLLSMANCNATLTGAISDEAEGERLRLIGEVFESNGLAPIQLLDETLPLHMANIGCPTARCRVAPEVQPKITVVMPAYNARDTLHIAVESLTRQTWKNLEIIIIDDVSADDTYAVAQSLAEADSRILVIQQEKNGGAYSCRNFALKYATGDFVTVHDSDDWSHPQKLELQATQLMKGREPANTTDWVRCLPHLFFRSTIRRGASRVGLNHSSLMMRRELLLALGGWDRVRIAADSEFLRRLEAYTGLDSVPRILKGVPLAFALDLPTSLTRQSVTQALTKFHGVRRNYHDASAYYRAHAAEQNRWRLSADEGRRAFPAPRMMLPERPPAIKCDLMVIMDFRLGGGAFVSTMNYVRSALAGGKTVSVYHYRRYDLDVLAPPSDELLALAHDEKVYWVSPGEEVIADTVLAGYPVVLAYPTDLAPKITCQRFGIITNQMHARLRSGGDVQYDPQVVSQNVRAMFGLKPVWIPISDLVRNLIIEDGRYEPLSKQTWNPLIDTSSWFGSRVSYRGGEREQPVVGRHARDHYTKWPTTPEAIRSAYCADDSCEVRLLGGTQVPEAILGRLPRNWRSHPFGSLDAKEFLRDLDFYVHYPHEDYIEEFGRAVLEALSLGIPVILPHVFEPTFKDAATYAEPDDVFRTISEIWRDPDLWRAKAESGIQFALLRDWTQFPQRLAALAAEFPASVSTS